MARRDDRDLLEEEKSITVKAQGGPHLWGLGGEFSRSSRRRWDQRTNQLGSDIGALTGLDLDAIAQRLAASEQLADLVHEATFRAARTANEEFRSALARLIAAGMTDDARLDEYDFLLRILLDLEPIHLRALKVLRSVGGVWVGIPSLRGVVGPGVKLVRLARSLAVQPHIAESIVTRLSGSGLVVCDGVPTPTSNPRRASQARPVTERLVPETAYLTKFGVELLKVCDEMLTEASTDDQHRE